MDNAEAKLILSSYTLGHQPEGDAKFDAAKQLAEQDAQLMEWWLDQQRHDRQIRAKLGEFDPPSDLRASLAASLAHQQQTRSTRRRWIQALSLAACLLLGFLVYDRFIIDRSDEYEGPLVDRAFRYSSDGPRLTYFNNDTQKITEWLVEQGVDLPNALPPKFLDQDGIGCRPLKWSEERVAIICVDAETVYHLFVAQAHEFPEFDAPDDEIAFEDRPNGWTVSRWKSNGYLFILTGQAPKQNLSAMLASYQP